MAENQAAIQNANDGFVLLSELLFRFQTKKKNHFEHLKLISWVQPKMWVFSVFNKN